MLILVVDQTEILHRLAQGHHSGFRRVAWTRTGTTLTSASAICLVVAHSALMVCSTRPQVPTLIAAGCAQSCKFLNSEIGVLK